MKKYDFSDFDESNEKSKKYDFSDFDTASSKNTSEDVPKYDTASGQVLQGALFGGGDELVAGLSALTDIAAGDPEITDYKDLYKRYLQSERDQLELEEKANPNTALTSNLAGSVLTGGVGGSVLAPTLKGLSLLQAGGKLAKAGAIGGALTGLGTSKGSLIDLQAGDGGAKTVAVDSLIGGGVGMIAAPAMGAGIAAIGKIPKATRWLGSAVDSLSERVPIAGKGYQALKGAFGGKKYFNNEEEYANALVNEAEGLVNLTKELGDDVFEQKRILLDEAKKSGKIADLENFLDDAIKLIEDAPGEQIQDFGARQKSMLDYYKKLRFGKKELVPEQVVQSKGEYTELTDNLPELQKKLELEALQAKSVGEQVVPKIDTIKTSSGEDYLFPKLITNKETGESVSTLKPIEAITKTPKVNTIDKTLPAYEKIIETPKNALDPNEVEKLILEIDAVLRDPNSAPFHSLAMNRLKELKKIQNNLVDGLEEANKNSSSIMQLTKLLTGKNPYEITPGFNEADLLGLDLNLAQNTLRDQVTNTFKRVELQKFLNGFKTVKGIKDLSPKAAKEMEDVLKRSKVAANDLDLAETVSGSVGPFKQASYEKLAIQAGEAIGSGAKKISQLAKSSALATAKNSALATVKNTSTEFMENIAMKARQPQFGEKGVRLANILTSMAPKSDSNRTATMFSLMQNPEYREILEQINPQDEGE